MPIEMKERKSKEKERKSYMIVDSGHLAPFVCIFKCWPISVSCIVSSSMTSSGFGAALSICIRHPI